MSEFKFSCPNCDQHIAADESWSGAQIQCPKCQSQIVVPRMAVAALATTPPSPAVPAAASPAPAPPPPLAPRVTAQARPVAPAAPAAQMAAPAFCALAIVSLVLALATLPLNVIGAFVGVPIGLLGCIPAVICGHLALGSIRRNRVLRGSGLAKWGLGLGYFFTVMGVISLAVFAYLKSTGQDLRVGRARPAAPFTSRPIAAPPPGPGAAPGPANVAPVAPPPGMPEADSPVTTNPERAEIPAKPAAGTLYGRPFTVDKAVFNGIFLQLAQGTKFMPDADIKVFPFLKAGESLADRTFVVSPQTTHGNPHVHLAGGQGGSSRAILTSKYALRLEFGKPTGKRIPFKLYFEAPHSYETIVSGEGVAETR
jgi:hypothetical protein